jgi:hypothetical protein
LHDIFSFLHYFLGNLAGKTGRRKNTKKPLLAAKALHINMGNGKAGKAFDY